MKTTVRKTEKIFLALLAALVPVLVILFTENISERQDFNLLGFAGFSFAALSMYFFLVTNIKLNRFGSLMLSVSYSLASINVVFMESTEFLPLIVLMPLFASACDFWRQKKNLPAMLSVIAAAFVISASSIFGIIFGVPFMLAVIVLISLAGHDGVKGILTEFILLLEKLVGGILLSSFIWIPNLSNISFGFSIKDQFEDGTVRFKLLDFLYRIFDGTGLTNDGRPAMYFSITLLILFILFAFNSRIPFRLRVTSLVIILACYACDAYTALDTVTGIVTSGNNSGWFRFSLAVFVMVYCGAIELKNIKTSPDTHISAASFAVICLVVISRMTHNDAIPYTYTAVITACDAGAAGFILLTYIRGHKESIKILSFLTVLMIAASTIMSFHQAEDINPVENLSLNATETFGSEIGLTMFEDERPGFNYVISVMDLDGKLENMSLPEVLNSVSSSSLCGNIFEKYDAIQTYVGGASSSSLGKYDADGTGTEIILSIEDYDMDNLYAVYSGFSDGGEIAFFDGTDQDDISFDGEYISLINRTKPIASMRLTVTGNGSGEYSIWKINSDAVAMMNNRIHHVEGDEFTLNITGNSDSNSVVTSLEYSKTTTVRCDGSRVKTFSIGGRLAFDVSGSGEHSITIEENKNTSIPGIAISISAAILIIIYNVIKRRKRESAS